ncbi:uncharacterized protein LOC121996346 [Zingiber officinale]|uniref:DUF7950 domain-containing protein n=1 Tax=Zingiber officinale TaxID=94328 RepID=A0A8J5I095_ZINOF|nr:uncharacterized protein LOC121996346 [Zingiber officinale]KAG6535476.1 hypothetical protein ZIOFF_000476 [Zingiber officinale]
MERRGGCCIDVYGRGDAAAAWRMGRIMLRFRPIAPKPVVDSSWAASAATAAASSVGRKTTRRKGSGGYRGRKTRKVETLRSSSSKDDPALSSPAARTSPSTIVTLPLMPEIPERKDDRASERRCLGSGQPLATASTPAWMDPVRADETAGFAWPATAVGSYSWVTVECVVDVWKEEEVSWRSDEAVWAALTADDCPGFVSDVWDRVTWTNEAYRRMVAGMPLEGRGAEEDVWVGLMTKGAVPAEASRPFTCRVRVHYSRRPGRGKGASCSSSLAAPCDVWRLADGGSAWRLDLKAALSLSL